jgi:hypothetical protein
MIICNSNSKELRRISVLLFIFGDSIKGQFIRISGSVQVSIYLASVNEVLMQSFGARISFIVERNNK